MGFYDNEGVVLPSTDCVLPDPRGPQYADEIMVTVDCTHCETKFLLVDRGEAAKWIDAEVWWAQCRTRPLAVPLERYGNYIKQPPNDYPDSDYEDVHFDFKKFSGPILPNEFVDCDIEVDNETETE